MKGQFVEGGITAQPRQYLLDSKLCFGQRDVKMYKLIMVDLIDVHSNFFGFHRAARNCTGEG